VPDNELSLVLSVPLISQKLVPLRELPKTESNCNKLFKLAFTTFNPPAAGSLRSVLSTKNIISKNNY
jgi:hypothetical protein